MSIAKRILYRLRDRKAPGYGRLRQLFRNQSGLEIGGPSRIFQNREFLPLYNEIKALDGCNFSGHTIWEGQLKEGETYQFGKRTGFQHLCEATDLDRIPSSKYDFVISSNCLEHVANPLKAIKEWARVIKEKGIFLVVVPNKDYCFDHKRSVTTFSHLLEDFKSDTQEDDMTHLAEILELHDLSMDKPAGTKEQFEVRSKNNFENRALHHHVFDSHLLKEIFGYFQIEVLYAHSRENHSILGRKSAVAQ
ncbi:MAG: methyltransferase domain-containing protein [Bacteroidota bacterium]